ncbi:MAG: DNA-binding protein [Candidatus Heimdallarchaeum aukensis]|uniref:DNA-binding protein K9W45_09005 n=1 Tax=Candidatus Heimdallarchaeum aukensis TaxID=2876573 RepID=A0A9Y1BJH9_9ARCH|nr:MAG: DNA-binding protein [Candidatus Heimdallarchaeum aukensis]
MGYDEELEEIRRRKLAQLQQNEAVRQMQKEQEANIEAQKQAILRQILTEDARQRLANVKLVRPQLAESVELQLIQLAQQGALRSEINDAQLKELLKKLQGQKRETKIDIRRI